MKSSGKTGKTLVQCDFDGTITEEDVSFLLLDSFADGDWRQLFRIYQQGGMSVGRFNQEAFAMVRASRESLLKVARADARIRAGFGEFVDFCNQKDFRLVVVSNGLDFYIKELLNLIGMGGIEVLAARTHFHPEGLDVRYIGPFGNPVDDEFKKAYTESFLKEGYQVVYIGNGISDVSPARECHYVFATGDMLARFRELNLDCVPFTTFRTVTKSLQSR